MRMVCISDNYDITVGLRLAGVQTFFIRDEQEIKDKIKELSKDPNVGILNVTENIYEIAKKELEEISSKQEMPLIATIPNTKS